jgi:cytochrome oxidase Cu insertion factor (SCO1/SenC/PrrC family)
MTCVKTPSDRSSAGARRATLSILAASLAGGVCAPLMAHQGHKHPSGKAAGNAAGAPAAPANNEVTQWEPTNLRLPNVAVRDQEGQNHVFHRDLVKGRKVLVNFVFTSCTSICSPMTATFRAVQQELTRRKIDDVHLISVSVDPLTDTPQVLRQYAKRFDAGPGWTFVTGSRKSIDDILKVFAVSAANFNDHSPMVYIGDDASGRWSRTFGAAAPESIVAKMTEVYRVSGPASSAPGAGSLASVSQR